jgi:hypothetical protein
MALYMQLIQRAPGHVQALTELGEIAFASGFRSAARTIYEQIVSQHPHDARGHVNLAHILSVSDERAAAKAHFHLALAREPDLAAAHRGLAVIYGEEGNAQAAAEHAERGFRAAAEVVKPYRGVGDAPRILLLVSARGGNIPTDLWLTDRRYHITALYAEYADPMRALPPHDLVFNAIGDADLCIEALAAAVRIVARTQMPVINPPDRIIPTGRVATAERFRALSGVRTPSVSLHSIADLRTMPEISFPLLLRRPGFHTGQHFHRIDDRIGFISTLDTFAGDGATEALLIDYLDARGSDGRARKYRVMFINGRLYPLHLAISDDWKVHYFTSAMADDADLRAEEAAFLNDPQGMIGAAGWAALATIASDLALDYAGIDFGLGPDGAICLFEANATMVLIPPGPEPIWDYRRPAIAAAFAAVDALLKSRLEKGLPESRVAAQDRAI